MSYTEVRTINLHTNDFSNLKEFNATAMKVNQGIIQLGQGFNTVNAKSLMDLFSLDSDKDITLVIHSENAEEEIKLFDKWVVERRK